MSRKFITSVLAASLAITSVSAVPARADGDDLVKFLAGATALVIIGNALDNDRDRSSRDSGRYDDRRDRDGRHDDRGGRVSRDHDDRYRHGYGRDERPKVYFDRRHDERATRDVNKRFQRNVLPSQCKDSFWTPEGTRSYMEGHCLSRNYSYSGELPKQCRITVMDKNRKKSGYSISCLQNRGYRVAGR